MIPVHGISDFTHKQFSNVKLNHKFETIYGTSQIGLSCEVVIILMLNVCNTVEEHLGLGNIGLDSWQIFNVWVNCVLQEIYCVLHHSSGRIGMCPFKIHCTRHAQ